MPASKSIRRSMGSKRGKDASPRSDVSSDKQKISSFFLRQLLTELHPDALFAFDTDGQFTFWNQKMEQITGLPSEKILGRTAWDVCPFLLETGCRDFYPEGLAGTPGLAKRRSLVSRQPGLYDVHYFPLVVHRKIIGGFGVVRSMKNAYQTEDQLRKASTQLEVWVQERTRELNEAVETLEKEIGRRLQAEQDLRNEIAIRKHIELDLEHLSLDLEHRVRERMQELELANQNLQEEMVRRERTQKDLELQSLIVANMAEGLCLLHPDTLQILYANPRFETLFGYTHGELKGKSLSHLLYPHGEHGIVGLIDRLRADMRRSNDIRIEMENMRKDGTPFWCTAHLTTFRHPIYGDVWVTVEEDITQRKRDSEELHKKEEELHQSRKIEAIGRLAGGVAHDFNNLITGIMGVAEEILESTGEHDPHRTGLEEIIQATNQAILLIRQLLAFGRRLDDLFKPGAVR